MSGSERESCRCRNRPNGVHPPDEIEAQRTDQGRASSLIREPRQLIHPRRVRQMVCQVLPVEDWSQVPKQDIVVVGTSAGGVEALRMMAAGLPADLKAAVFVVLHIGKGTNGLSYMPEILSKAGPLPAVHPKNGEPIEIGKIYVAPPDCHLVLVPGNIQLSNGPKENRTRPAINPLFRSAALAYEDRVTGVILTGALDDGVAGLAEIKRKGGVAVVQDPQTALFPSMPENALKHVEVDHVTSLSDIGGLIARLAVTERNAVQKEDPMERKPSQLTCPGCRGPLSEERQGTIVEYRCRVGHVYSPLAMEDEHHETVERSLWSTIVALEEAAEIAELLTPELGPLSMERARNKRNQAAILKAMFNESLAT
jgi:two-component system chemotaxis response regulator CheB